MILRNCRRGGDAGGDSTPELRWWRARIQLSAIVGYDASKCD